MRDAFSTTEHGAPNAPARQLSGLDDDRLAEAIGKINTDPARPWTTAELAKEARCPSAWRNRNRKIETAHDRIGVGLYAANGKAGKA